MDSNKENKNNACEAVEDINDDINSFSNVLKRHEESTYEPTSKLLKLTSPSKQDFDLSLNTALENTELLYNLQKNWINTSPAIGFKDSQTAIEIYKEPFELCLFPDLLMHKESCRMLVDEMVEKVVWSRKQMDLYEFYQSTDLSNMAECTFLTKFLQMLRRQVRPWLEKVTGLKLDYVSASCSMYTSGDYLLVHDDLLKDRQVAFVYYLSPWEGAEQWSEQQGGCLEIFNTDSCCLPQFPVCNKIRPKNNQFVFFKVGARSFHQVGEVTNFDYPRLTINGWFHGATNEDLLVNSLRPFTKLNFKVPLQREEEECLEELIKEIYLRPNTRRSIQQRIEDNSEICLFEFFKRDIFQESLNQLLHDKTLNWRRQGPANAQNYEVLELSTATSTLSQLIKTFSSAEMFKLLHDYTDLDLAGPDASEPTYSLELQRWTNGNYTILGDGAICDENTLDLIYYLNATDGAGVITYLSPEEEKEENCKANKDDPSTRSEDSESESEQIEYNGYNREDEDDSVLLTITPIDNSLNIVYRCEDKYRLISSLAFMTVILVIGVPMWWKTTEVYRVNLPSEDILSLEDVQMRTAINIGIYAFKLERSAHLIDELSAAFQDNEFWHINFQQVPEIENASNALTPARLEAMLLKQYTLKAGDFIFIEWPKLTDEVLLTTERSALFKTDASAAKIKLVIDLLILQTYKIEQNINSTNPQTSLKIDPPQLEYDVVISVLNPRPDAMHVKWDVKTAAETYIAPFLREINQVSSFTIKTQWKYQLAFEADLKQKRDHTKIGRHYAISESSLPHIITSIEKHLGMGITDKSTINLIIYIPPCEIAPLHIYNRDDQMATRDNVDSFISPKWGGIIIVNPPMESCTAFTSEKQYASFYVNTNDAMQIALYQLQKLLDIMVETKIDGVKIVDLEQIAPRRWEYESYIRRSTISYINTASNTLQSLIKLLDNISYIVINDDVGKAINDAYINIHYAKDFLESGDLINASIYAKRAYATSEQAFFDSSLLAQLYFPDEQKYAIYIPLFLPIMVPVFTSFSTVRKLFIKLWTDNKLKIN